MDRGIFVPLRLAALIGRSRSPVAVVGKVNTGYAAERPELILPAAAAAEFGWWPKLPKGAEPEEYDTVGGPFRIYRIRSGLRIRVWIPDRRPRATLGDGVISPAASEILIGAGLISALRIVALDPSAGLWCFRDEIAKKERRSSPRQIW